MRGLRPVCGGFSTLELLAIMMILIIVLATLLPVIRTLNRTSRENQNRARGQALLHGVMEYRRVYRQWPGQTQDVADAIYATTNDASHLLRAIRDNPRGLHLLDREGGSVVDGYLADPWGLPYVVGFDENQDGRIELNITNGPLRVATNVQASAVVMSWGPLPSDPDKHLFLWTP